MCGESTGLIYIGADMYFLSGDGNLMPSRKGQAAPDLFYFNRTKK
jgi:hypothetical protein